MSFFLCWFSPTGGAFDANPVVNEYDCCCSFVEDAALRARGDTNGLKPPSATLVLNGNVISCPILIAFSYFSLATQESMTSNLLQSRAALSITVYSNNSHCH